MGGGETSEGGVGTGDVVRVGYFRGEGGRDGEEGEGLEGCEGFDDGVLWRRDERRTRRESVSLPDLEGRKKRSDWTYPVGRPSRLDLRETIRIHIENQRREVSETRSHRGQERRRERSFLRPDLHSLHSPLPVELDGNLNSSELFPTWDACEFLEGRDTTESTEGGVERMSTSKLEGKGGIGRLDESDGSQGFHERESRDSQGGDFEMFEGW